MIEPEGLVLENYDRENCKNDQCDDLLDHL